MNIDSISNGVVLDHIQSGKSMEIYKHLHLDRLDCQVAIIKKRPQRAHGEEGYHQNRLPYGSGSGRAGLY